MNYEMIMQTAVNAVNDKKGRDIRVVKIDELTTVADYFLFVTATSSTHVRALADEVEDKLSEIGVEPHHIEGKSTGWILLDYTGLVVHIFTPSEREFYSLDRMWNEGTEVDISKICSEEG